MCLLVYDITHDGTRGKVSDACLDYGLQRIQYSAFLGDLSRAHQEELFRKVRKRLEVLNVPAATGRQHGAANGKPSVTRHQGASA